MVLIKRLPIAFGLAILVGCSGQPAGVGDVAGAPIELLEVGDLVKAAAATGRPAGSVADFDKHRPMYPRGYDAVKKGDIVVLWGARPKGEGAVAKGGEEVVAYEKAVPNSGGYVLFSAGSIRKMTAAEFQAAPKGGKP
jgi:hypothetical protein